MYISAFNHTKLQLHNWTGK